MSFFLVFVFAWFFEEKNNQLKAKVSTTIILASNENGLLKMPSDNKISRILYAPIRQFTYSQRASKVFR